jgi:type IV pilus assembly protein PilW
VNNRIHATAARQRGLTLIELMVSMALGLLLIAGAVSLTVANRRSYDTNQGMSQVQESARTAFELMARDIRQAGPSGCGNPARVTANLVAGTLWWQTPFWIRGFGGLAAGATTIGTATNERVTGTDAIQTQGLQGQGFSVAVHTTAAATIQLSTATDIVVDDALVACDGDHTTIFRASTYNSGTNTLGITTGLLAGQNCSTGLGFPTVCGGAGTVYQFPRNSLVARLSATEWYIGRNGRTTDTGRSLYRLRLGSAATPVAEEIVSDVVNMSVNYRVGTSDIFVPPALVITAADWANVNAVRIELTVDSADTRVSADLGTNSGRISRTFTQLIALRNRMP